MVHAALFLLLCPFILSGCLSRSYYVERDELVRLATVEPQYRWQSVRAVQRIGGDDYPPADESVLPPPASRPGDVYPAPMVFHSHHHHHHAGFFLAPRSIPPVRAAPPSARPSGGVGAISGAAKKGNGKAAAAVLVAAAVVVGAGAGFALAASEGARYDGWVAVHPDEPLHLTLADGRTTPVRISSLTPGEAAVAARATIYEGQEDRFARLGRAPFHRTGFTLTTAMHLAGVPQIDRTAATAFGGYFHLGGNIANFATLGLAATADTGLDSKHSMLVATLAPEMHLYPTRYVGFYGGGGWSFRNTRVDGATRADEGWVIRGGLVGEIPLTTRLALQARAGAMQHSFQERAFLTWEGTLGLAIY